MASKNHFNLFLLILFSSFQALSAQNDPEPVVTSGHKNQITALDFSPDGKFLVSGGLDNYVKVWDLNIRQEFRTLYGHKNGLKRVKFSPDGKSIVSQTLDGTIMVFSHPEGKKQAEVEGSYYPFSFFPQGKSLLISQNTGRLAKVDLVTGKTTQVYDQVHASQFVLHPNGNQVIGNGPGDQDSLWIYDLGGKQKTKTIPTISGWMHIAISPDGNWVCITNTTGELEVINISTGKRQFMVKAKTLFFNAIKFSQDSKNVFALDQSKKVLRFEVNSGKEFKFLDYSWDPANYAAMIQNGEPITSMMPQFSMSPDGKLMGICLTQSVASLKEKRAPETYNKIKLFDIETVREVGEFISPFKSPMWMDLPPGGEELLISDAGTPIGIRHWNLKEGQIDRYQFDTPYAALSPDGKVLAYFKIDFETFKMTMFLEDRLSQKVLKKFQVKTAGYALAFSPNGKKLAVTYYEFDPKTQAVQSYISQYEVESGKELFTSSVEQLESGFTMEYSPDGKHIFLEGITQSTIWDAASGTRVQLSPRRGWQQWIDFTPDGKFAVVGGFAEKDEQMGARLHFYDLKTGEMAEHKYPEVTGHIYCGEFSPDGKYLAVGTGGVVGDFEFHVELFAWPSLEKVCTFKGHDATVMLLKWSKEGDKLVSAANDGMIKIWDWENCTERATLIAMNQQDYIILEPGGRYKASKGQLQGVGFRYQGKLLSYEQLDLRFNRPDLVMESLGASPLKVKILKMAWEKRLRKMGFTEDQMTGSLTLPSVSIENKLALPLSTAETKLKFRVNAWDEQNSIDRINLYVNNVPIYGMNGKSLKNSDSKKFSETLEVELGNGINRVQVSVLNDKGLESFRESFEVNCEREAIKPDLYLLTLGVSEYEDSERNLRFAAKDAQDLASGLSKSGRFGKVRLKSLLNGEVTRESVEAANAFFRPSKVNDVVAVFYSGHGLLSESLDYYLATAKVDFLKPETNGLPYETLEGLVDKVAARYRLVMIDACHSGEIDKEEAELEPVESEHGQVALVFKGGINAPKPKAGLNNSFAYMQALFADVTKGTGATVISAAGGYEFALESGDWNNGVFTFSILQGLQSREADLNKDRKIDLSELKSYVTDKVSELTNGKQVPTSRKENLGVDFVVY